MSVCHKDIKIVQLNKFNIKQDAKISHRNELATPQHNKEALKKIHLDNILLSPWKMVILGKSMIQRMSCLITYHCANTAK